MNQRAKLATRATRAQRLAHEQAVRRHRHWLWIGVTITAVVAAVVAVLVAVGRDSGSNTPSTPAATPKTVSADGAGVVVGTGPVPVEVYADFLCPGCGYFERDAIDDIQTLIASKSIRLIYHPVAILDQASTTRYSTRSAAGAGCAADSGKLLPYVKVLFEMQPAEGSAGYSDEQLIGLASSVGITDPAFATCVRDGRYVKWTASVTSAMTSKNILSTPTVFVAGQQLASPTGAALVAAVHAAG